MSIMKAISDKLKSLLLLWGSCQLNSEEPSYATASRFIVSTVVLPKSPRRRYYWDIAAAA